MSFEVFQTKNEEVTMVFTNDIDEVKEKDIS